MPSRPPRRLTIVPTLPEPEAETKPIFIAVPSEPINQDEPKRASEAAYKHAKWTLLSYWLVWNAVMLFTTELQVVSAIVFALIVWGFSFWLGYTFYEMRWTASLLYRLPQFLRQRTESWSDQRRLYWHYTGGLHLAFLTLMPPMIVLWVTGI